VLADRIKSIKSRLENISVNQKEYNIEHAPTTVALSSSTTAISAWYATGPKPYISINILTLTCTKCPAVIAKVRTGLP
jgi:hypothetical protein